MTEQQYYLHRHTYAGAVETIEGVIPHARIVWRGGVVFAPVRIVSDCKRVADMKGMRRPERDHRGRLVYALPGGGKFVQ